ncbi:MULTISPECIES: CDP-diacylglycerol diphosphatase [Shewanella]|uniref:CDP-diacylglycerol diphosphatase n=1 Tax=Shewanella TaxID=22 RepID=UPI0016753D07|nr:MULTISPECIES: CDP-diacylglycerol diphosphatase [Shewanella]MBO1272211.1 CDP-diacylglycerol diphosphatase [Shewanella sp. 4t3-1-2LB]MCL2906151.1 CDP-diacylglycerol diphosphatase [Shewanella fodinae]GGY98778.1 CDP-diacylglycerol pyrophosphatase [Shewanella fodinae]
MVRTPRKFLLVFAVLILVAAATATYFWQTPAHNPDALWHLISERCVPDMEEHGKPAPCSEVNESKGYVTLKDRHGILQYLLMPVDKISGVESPELLQPLTPNFFAIAWQQRALAIELMAQQQRTVPDRALSLAINSAYGRTQNQLHIHISCLRQDVRQQLDSLTPTLTSQWQQHELGPSDYLLRTLTPQQLQDESVFIRLAQELPEAADDMGHYGLALANLPNGQLVLMAIKANWLTANNASAEELQDHSCSILQPTL